MNDWLRAIAVCALFLAPWPALEFFENQAQSADVGPVMPVKITGGDEAQTADVILDSGRKKLAVLATTVVEQVFGQDPQGTTYFFFGSTLSDANGIGAAGDTVRVQIPAAPSPLNTVYPAVDYTYTVQASDVAAANPERAVALNFCSGINLDANFLQAEWKCTVAKDFALVHIESRLFNENGERTSWTTTCSGTTACNQGYADIARRGKPTELARSPNDPRQGILSISGTVTTLPGGIGDQFQELFKNGGSSDMRVNGSVSAVNFRVEASATNDLFIDNIRCFGGGNGIKFGQFLSQSGSGLTNGIEVVIKSDDSTFTFLPIKKTEDWKNKFASAPDAFKIDVQAGADQFVAQFDADQPFPLRVQGSFTTNDYMQISIRDNITSNLNNLECLAYGFEKEP